MEIDENLKKEILSQPFFRGKVVTGSMLPVIQIGDSIVVEVKATKLRRFDILVFVQDNVLICHYLWTKNKVVQPVLYQTRNMGGGKDFPFKEEDYIGRVISHRLNFWQKLNILLFK